MPIYDPDPIDPNLDFAGDIGPGRINRPDDRAKLASAIEKKTGAAPSPTRCRTSAGRS